MNVGRRDAARARRASVRARPTRPADDTDRLETADCGRGRGGHCGPPTAGCPGRRGPGHSGPQKLLECTAEMLHETSYRDLKVVEIARGAGTSPATFYQYFPDVEAAILVLGRGDGPGRHARSARSCASGPGRARPATPRPSDLVDAFLAFWEEHRSLLRVVDLATARGRPAAPPGPHPVHPRAHRRPQRGRRRLPQGGQATRPTSTPWPPAACSSRCSARSPPTATASSSGASAPTTPGAAWPGSSTPPSPAPSRLRELTASAPRRCCRPSSTQEHP